VVCSVQPLDVATVCGSQLLDVLCHVVVHSAVWCGVVHGRLMCHVVSCHGMVLRAATCGRPGDVREREKKEGAKGGGTYQRWS